MSRILRSGKPPLPPRRGGRPRQAAAALAAWSIGVLVSSVPAADASAADDRTYHRPRHGDVRLDWCTTWGQDCGRPVAQAFCLRRRFASVVVFRAEKVGRSEPTRLIGSGQTCSGHDFCTAFASITCADPVPAERVFANPAWKGRRLDVCRLWGAECGKPAADAFCRAKGFADALHAVADEQPGYAPTTVIGSGQVCDKPFCRGFQQIICR